MLTLKERSDVAINCLPQSEYSNRLRALHADMLQKIKELQFYRENHTCIGCRGDINHCGCGIADES